MTIADEKLRRLVKAAPSSVESLLTLLLEGLDWPIPAGMDLDEVPLDWSLDDLHLDPDKVARLRSIKQIPRLVHQQKFGVFVLNFEGGTLPIGAVRRVVDKLVATARTRKHTGTMPTWALDELIFFCQTKGSEPTLHVVALRDVDGRRQLRVSSWSKSAPEPRLDLVLRKTMRELRWSIDAGGPTIGAESGQRVFHEYRYAIRTADALARRMADVARELRDEATALYEVETDSGPMRTLFRELQTQLIATLTASQFADVYAQTMVYGMLAARIAHPEQFKAESPSLNVHLGNPLLESLQERFTSSTKNMVAVDELGLGELADMLAEVSIEELLADFGAGSVREDPVVHFYESFLAYYDPLQRVELGAFYTPTAIVKCMVRLVDEVLSREFGVEEGIAGSISWREMAERVPGLEIPDGTAESDPYFAMLDPATGTGTFLVEWLRLLGSKQSKSGASGVSSKSPAVGLEVSLPPYSVAQLRLALEQRHEPRGDEPRATVLLTDTLAEPDFGHVLRFEDDIISEQGRLADEIKSSRRQTVIIGNPPYGDKAKGRGPYVEASTGVRGPLLNDFTPDAVKGLGAHLKILRNLYVFFWRFAADQAWLTPPSRPGVVSLITSAAWLSGPVFERMRKFLIRDAGADLWIIDLGGDQISGDEGDENVFPIRTPVAVVMAVRGANPSGDGTVRRLALRGTAAAKLRALEGLTLDDPRWTIWNGQAGEPIGEAESQEWMSNPSLGDLIPFAANGVHQQRTWVNDPSPETLRHRWKVLTESPHNERPRLMKETRSRKVTSAGKNLVNDERLGPILNDMSPNCQEPIRYSFRFLDRQWLIPDSRIIDMPSPDLWRVRSASQFFLNELHSQPLGSGPGVVVAPYIPNLDHFKGNSGGRVFPAWRNSKSTVANVAPGLPELLSEEFGSPVESLDVIAYVVGAVGHRGYVKRFSSELHSPGVRVPLTKSQALFEQVVALGKRVIWVSTYGAQFSADQGCSPGAPPRLEEPRRWPEIHGALTGQAIPSSLRFDSDSETLTIGEVEVRNVSQAAYDYSISGMPVLRKWFGYRKSPSAAKWSSPLNDIGLSDWPADWTQELLDLIHALTLLIDVESEQDLALEGVMDGPRFSIDELGQLLVWPPNAEARKPQS